MQRTEATKRIQEIIGSDLRLLAEEYGVTVFKNGRKNKGWAGHVIERYLGIPINSSQAPNFGTWELKTISLKYLQSGKLTIKETMAITMIDPYNIARTDFENSHLLDKMRKILIVARIWNNPEEDSSLLFSLTEFNLDVEEVYNQVKADYDLVRETVIESGFDKLTGKMGVYIQPRTKGAGHGSKSRAFYARTSFLKEFILPEL